MSMKFTQIPPNTFQELQMNAGYFATDFDPSDGSVDAQSIIGATSGGASITATPSYTDLGEDIDNCPKNTKELKHLDGWEIKSSGTFVTISPTVTKMLLGAADVGATDTTKVTPRSTVSKTDFKDLWWVGDYSDKNGTANGGFIAIHLMNTLSTGGFQIKSTDKSKGQFAFEFTAHISIAQPEVVPIEIYVKAGTEETVD